MPFDYKKSNFECRMVFFTRVWGIVNFSLNEYPKIIIYLYINQFLGQSNKLKGATTPHPLVFGFKPVASLVSSALEGVFVPKKPTTHYPHPHHYRPPPPPPPPRPPSPPQHFNRQPKFFFRQTYQQTKPIRFPLGFF